MERRSFLKLFSAATTTAIVAPKVYIMPPPAGWLIPGGIANNGPVKGFKYLSAEEILAQVDAMLKLHDKGLWNEPDIEAAMFAKYYYQVQVYPRRIGFFNGQTKLS